jgi:leucyl aminopeptidase
MKIRIGKGGSSARADLVMSLAAEGITPQAGTGLAKAVTQCKATGDLRAAFRAVSLFHPTGSSVKRLGFVGLGKAKEVTTEKLRRAAALAQARAEQSEVRSFRMLVAADVAPDVSTFDLGCAVAEGLLLGAYQYEPPRQKAAKARKGQDCEVVYAGRDNKAFAAGFKLGKAAAEATRFTRDIENQAGNLCTPTILGQAAKKLAGAGTTVKVLDVAAMKRLKMGALLGVARGGKEPPKFIVLHHKVPGAKDTVCVVGKGLTFDTGGISIKPSAKMDEMRYDMCGGGAVLGLFHALRNGGLAGCKPRCNIVGLVPASENMPGSDAQKPGDIVRAMDGQTIEVLNTDAEGRLILADALAYARKFHQPKFMVDLATLTGAVIVALGHEVAGVMGNDDKLIADLIDAGEKADEPLWQLPLWDVHKEQMKSRFADLKNINAGQGNGTIAGAAFLSYFAGDTRWAHIDIAGTAWGGIGKDYYKSGASGTAVRMLLRWVRSL